MPRKYNRYQKQILLNMPSATHFRNLCKYNILKEKNTTQKQQECNFSLILRSCFKFTLIPQHYYKIFFLST